MNQNEEMLKKNFSELTELKHILRKTQQFFEEVYILKFNIYLISKNYLCMEILLHRSVVRLTN